jgi:ComF family protein
VAIDWIFPPYCAGCKKIGYRWCNECQNKTIKVSNHQCVYCGRTTPENYRCAHCVDVNGNLDQIFIWGNHDGPLRQALHKLKYRRDLGLGEKLSTCLIGMVKDNDIQGDLIVPIPLGVQRLRERGYNQAALLARPFALALRLPYRPRALKRVKETRTQVGLSITQRRKNVEGAFKADPKIVSGKSVILMDDGMTTGATLDEAGQALKEAGANRIVAFSLAKAVKMFY